MSSFDHDLYIFYPNKQVLSIQAKEKIGKRNLIAHLTMIQFNKHALSIQAKGKMTRKYRTNGTTESLLI